MSALGVSILWFAKILNGALTIYFWVIFARALFSWIRPNPYNPIVRTVYRLVDPVTYRISRILPTRFGMVDIAPFFLMLIIIFLQEFLTRALLHLALRA
ncbi:MAG: YggT family protein [Eubacteriales bacterium]|nr:YggT family protein [Eubacteriales bacterium]MDD3845498.1 YggT family protein [Syntrophorhabdaceae bacterium]